MYTLGQEHILEDDTMISGTVFIFTTIFPTFNRVP